MFLYFCITILVWFSVLTYLGEKQIEFVQKSSALVAISSSSSISTFIPCIDSNDLTLEVAFIALSGEIFYNYVLKQAAHEENSCSGMCEKK